MRIYFLLDDNGEKYAFRHKVNFLKYISHHAFALDELTDEEIEVMLNWDDDVLIKVFNNLSSQEYYYIQGGYADNIAPLTVKKQAYYIYGDEWYSNQLINLTNYILPLTKEDLNKYSEVEQEKYDKIKLIG